MSTFKELRIALRVDDGSTYLDVPGTDLKNLKHAFEITEQKTKKPAYKSLLIAQRDFLAQLSDVSDLPVSFAFLKNALLGNSTIPGSAVVPFEDTIESCVAGVADSKRVARFALIIRIQADLTTEKGVVTASSPPSSADGSDGVHSDVLDPSLEFFHFLHEDQNESMVPYRIYHITELFSHSRTLQL